MARPLSKKDLTRPPGIERKIDIALPQDWATLSRRAREINPQSGDFLPSECLVHLVRDALRRREDRIARVLMRQLLKRAEANLERTVPDSRMRDAKSVRHEILSDLAMMFTQDGTEWHEDELDFYECKFLRALRFLRIDHVRKALSERKELTDLPEADDGEGEAAFDEEMLARLSRMASVGPSQEDRRSTSCRRIKSAPSCSAVSSDTRRNRPQRFARWTSGRFAIALLPPTSSSRH
jgi:hypothetical protein